jgi:hypothetical protein
LPDQACWYTLESFRKLYPEYSDLSPDILASRLHSQARVYGSDPGYWIETVFEAALIPPAIVLILGAAFVWAFSGFARSPSREIE